MTWLGHATASIETRGVRLLTDPVLGRRAGMLARMSPPLARDAPGRVDAVLLSHMHADHADLHSLRRLGRGIPIVAPQAAVRWLRRRGFRRVRGVTAGSIERFGDVTVEAVPARHDGRRWPLGGAVEAVGFLVEGGASVYFAGDTDLFPEMAALRGRVDLALLPVAGWGPNLGPGHLDPERAARAAAVIEPRVAIPIHWGTLAPIGARPPPAGVGAPAEAFAAAAAREAPSVEVRVLAPGSTEVVRAHRGATCAPRGATAPQRR